MRSETNQVLVEPFKRQELKAVVDSALSLDCARILESVLGFLVESFSRRIAGWIEAGVRG